MNVDCSNTNNTCNGGWQNNAIIINSDNVILNLTKTIQEQAALIGFLTNRVLELEEKMLDNKLLQYVCK